MFHLLKKDTTKIPSSNYMRPDGLQIANVPEGFSPTKKSMHVATLQFKATLSAQFEYLFDSPRMIQSIWLRRTI